MSTPIAKAMVLVRRPRDGALLVARHTDGDGSGYERPLGGHIEFGERAAGCARREVLEETGQALRNVRLLEVMENLFSVNGSEGHEIVFLFEADFVDRSAYDVEAQVILDEPNVPVRWRRPEEDSPPLVPAGVERYLQREFSDDAHRQSAAVASGGNAVDDQAFVDRVSLDDA